jgi:hypothetical protein
MGLNFDIYVGTNKATCKICGERIKQNEFQINASGYQTSGSIHLKCANLFAKTLWNNKEIRNKMILKKGCFRAYPNAELCFAAHSELLKHKRYEQLFTLDKRDYKNWALGLQKLGYATDPDYAKKIIVLIERYRLNEFDNE